jgi:hypothetical protein
MIPYHVARRHRVCSVLLSCFVAVLAASVFALWFGMNSDADNVPPLLTQLIPAGHCTCQTSTLFNCSASLHSFPVPLAPSSLPRWTYNYARDHQRLDLSPAQCNSAFNGLFEDIHRAAAYWKDRNGISKRDLDSIPLRNGMARAAVYNGRLYVVETHAGQEDHRRKILAILNSIQRALSTTTNPDGLVDPPNLEFVFSVEDKLEDLVPPSKNHPIWVLGRKATEESVWLLPDFGFWAWENKFNAIGPYDQVVESIVAREKRVPWEEKHKKLVWRGKLSFAPKLRRALLDAARNKPWGDVKELLWKNKANFLSMEEHCDYMFIAHVEG